VAKDKHSFDCDKMNKFLDKYQFEMRFLDL
jgi:hypothetical protein